jgi:hypothetical protein
VFISSLQGSGGNGLMNVATQKCFDFWTTTAGWTAELNTCRRFGNLQGLTFDGYYIDGVRYPHFYIRNKQRRLEAILTTIQATLRKNHI